MGLILSYLMGQPQSNEPDPVTGLTPKEKQLIEKSWNLLRKDLVGNGVQLYMIYLKSYPEYKKLFPFRDVPFEELPNNKKLKGHAANVMYTLSAAIDNINNNDILMDVLEKSGISHGKKNVSAKSYWELKISAMEMLEQQLGLNFTQETREAWDKMITLAFSVIINALKEHQPQ